MEKAEFRRQALQLGWIEDAFGHLKSPSGQTRIKFQARSLRVEKRYQPEPAYGYTPPTQWLNIISDYYKNITSKEGRPVIKGRVLKQLGAQA